VSGTERPLASVPAWLWAALVASMAAQVALQSLRPPPAAGAQDLPPAPRAAALRAASLGEPAAASRLTMLYLQSFDLGAGNRLAYRNLDYGRLREWLQVILDTDPRSNYPLFAASRIYADVEDDAKCRQMLDFVHQAFFGDPNRRWASLAQAALTAKYRLHDLSLAKQYSADLQRLTTDPAVPLWAKQMEIFILEDLNELDAAKIMLGGLLASGKLQDPGERRFLQGRLEAIEKRLASKHRR